MDGSSMPPQPSAKGQQGAPEIGVSDAEMIQFYQQVLANCQHQAGRSSMLVEKLRTAIVERDAAIAQRDARIAALESDISAQKAALDIAQFEATPGELVEVPAEPSIYREEFPGLMDAKPTRQKRSAG